MVEDDTGASHQLQAELEDCIATGFSHRRPTLTHLNADTTWLLSLPYPEGSDHPAHRQRFNILIDPWLTGPQSDVARWFSTQWHNIKSCVQSITELNALLEARETSVTSSNGTAKRTATGSFIDVVVISHEFTDHCHQATLQEISPSVPIFATTKAAAIIRSWKHFKQINDVASFGPETDWRTTSREPLPPWLGIGRLITSGDSLYLHSAIVICFQILDKAESLIYTPHGVKAATFSIMLSAKPFVKNLAFLHGLHDVSILSTKQLNLGAFNAVQAATLLQSVYWVGTHDEVKKGSGIIFPLLKRKAWNLGDVWSKGSLADSKKQQTRSFGDSATIQEPRYVDLRSGESLVLE